MTSHRQYPDKIYAVYRDFTLLTKLDKNGKIIPRNDQDLLKYPMPTDKMLFAPTFQIINLFDPMPYEPTLANDLSSFTQVFIHTLLAQRIAEGVSTHPELAMYRKMLETDPLELRKNRDSQCSDTRAILAYYGDGTPDSQGPPAKTGRFGDMVSIMKFLWLVIQVNCGQGVNNRFPSQWSRYEGDPTKATEEYDHYAGQFRELAEDYEEVQALMRAQMEASFERLREKARKEAAEREEAEKRAAEGKAEREKGKEVQTLHA